MSTRIVCSCETVFEPAGPKSFLQVCSCPESVWLAFVRSLIAQGG